MERTSKYCFVPYPNNFGASSAVIVGGIFDANTQSYVAGSESEMTITATVINKNDRPVIWKSTFMAPRALSYNLSDVKGEGFSVSEVFGDGDVSDPDTENINDIGNDFVVCIT